MSIVNRRNAVLGWLTWEFGKRFAKQKAKSAVPALDEGGRPNKGLIVSALAAIGAVVFFWRRKRSDETTP